MIGFVDLAVLPNLTRLRPIQSAWRCSTRLCSASSSKMPCALICHDRPRLPLHVCWMWPPAWTQRCVVAAWDSQACRAANDSFLHPRMGSFLTIPAVIVEILDSRTRLGLRLVHNVCMPAKRKLGAFSERLRFSDGRGSSNRVGRIVVGEFMAFLHGQDFM